jgi:hypothetical protein
MAHVATKRATHARCLTLLSTLRRQNRDVMSAPYGRDLAAKWRHPYEILNMLDQGPGPRSRHLAVATRLQRSVIVASHRTLTRGALIVDALTAEIERVRQDEDFTSRAKRLLDRDRELLERLAR